MLIIIIREYYRTYLFVFILCSIFDLISTFLKNWINLCPNVFLCILFTALPQPLDSIWPALLEGRRVKLGADLQKAIISYHQQQKRQGGRGSISGAVNSVTLVGENVNKGCVVYVVLFCFIIAYCHCSRLLLAAKYFAQFWTKTIYMALGKMAVRYFWEN